MLEVSPFAQAMYLRKHLTSYFPTAVRSRGSDLYFWRKITILTGDRSEVTAHAEGTQLYFVRLAREGQAIHVYCDCAYFDTDGPCKHLWATILAAEAKNYLLGFTGKIRLEMDSEEDFDPSSFDLLLSPAHKPSERRISPPKPTGPQWREILSRLTPETIIPAHNREGWRTDREIYYLIDSASPGSNISGIPLEINYREKKQTGEWGKLKNTRIPRGLIPQIPDPLDREILTVLGGVPDVYSYQYDSLPLVFRMKHTIPSLLLPKMCATGRCRLRANSLTPLEAMTPLAWDDGAPWEFKLIVEREKENWLVRGKLARGDESMDLAKPIIYLEDGYLIHRGLISQFDGGGAAAWLQLLLKQPHISVPADQGEDFVEEILKRPKPPRIDWPEELQFESVRMTPVPRVEIHEEQRAHWKSKSERFEAVLSFDYDGRRIPARSASEGHYDVSTRRYFLRDRELEAGAAQKLRELGFKPVTATYAFSDADWELSPKKLPVAVRELVKAGWHIEADGKMFRKPGAFRAELSSGIDWFELHGGVDYGDGEVKLPELLKAIQKGEHMVRLSDGTFGIIPDELLERYGMLVGFGQTKGDHIQFSRAQAGLLDVLLADRPEIQVDEMFARARAELRNFDGIAAAQQPAGFVGELRHYQREGLGWMDFLRRFGIGGCLADDMGVGKTPQVLAMLEARRQLRGDTAENGNGDATRIGPSLVVVPRSLVYNWQQEAARFCPQLRVLDHTGVGRVKDVAQFENFDVILTTYGTLRRDVVDFESVRFDYAVLDEAQAIKNAGSESAKAARLLQANHRLVMSGTPVENHLGELWSLFEFLNPGMLGTASVFQSAGGALRNPDEASRELLAKAVRPCILRRTKDQVATELPAKLEQTLFCELDVVQRKLYNEMRDHFRNSLLKNVEAVGLAKSKMMILEALLRLRQAACHPGLIDKKRVGESSAKLEILLAQLSQVMDEGHKALVFSQFTSMLAIVRENLDRDGVVYEYLDGKTKDRQARVERFQNDPECKLFLVSLKAGGVGLNLTAAEYVFLLDPWWNPAVEMQAIDRAHRIGQSKRVFAYRLIARETVEEKVLELQEKKRALADAIINADNRLVGDMKREDLELLFS
jgi:hypothetical protein